MIKSRATLPAKDSRSPAPGAATPTRGSGNALRLTAAAQPPDGPHSPFFILARTTSITAGSKEMTMIATMSNLRFC